LQPCQKKNEPRMPEKSEITGYSAQILSDGKYVVQVSIYKLASAADKVKNRLIAKGFPAYVAEIDDPTPELLGTYYRVRIGYFNGLSKARAFGENSLEPLGYSYWADLARNDNISIPADDDDDFASSDDTYIESTDDDEVGTAMGSGPEETNGDNDYVSSNEPSNPTDNASTPDDGSSMPNDAASSDVTGSDPEASEDDW